MQVNVLQYSNRVIIDYKSRKLWDGRDHVRKKL